MFSLDLNLVLRKRKFNFKNFGLYLALQIKQIENFFVGIEFRDIILETPYDNLTVYKLRVYDGHNPLEVLSPFFFVERTTLSQFTAGFTLLPTSKNALYALSMTHNT